MTNAVAIELGRCADRELRDPRVPDRKIPPWGDPDDAARAPADGCRDRQRPLLVWKSYVTPLVASARERGMQASATSSPSASSPLLR